MRLVDTVVIIGSLDTGSSLHRECMRHLNRLADEPGIFIPTSTILEVDLVMKGRGYSHDERRASWQAIEYRVPPEKVVANSISSLQAALELQEKGMDYFDSLIYSLAMMLGAKVVTTDQAIKKVVDTEW